jgi:hypothetical protein
MSELQFALMTLEPFIMLGVVVGIVLAVIIGFARIGYKLAPYIAIAALIYYLLQAMDFIVALQS